MDEIVKVAKGRLAGVVKIAPASYVDAGRPKFPKTLTASQRPMFKKLCRLLSERRTLTEADAEIIRLYCVFSDRHAKAMQSLEAEGEIIQTEKGPRTSPWLAIAERTEAKMISILDRLGLTPASRDRVKVTRRTLEPNTLEILLTPELPKAEAPQAAAPEQPDTSSGEST
jgi:P27 family predicted phage terminase small subunit